MEAGADGKSVLVTEEESPRKVHGRGKRHGLGPQTQRASKRQGAKRAGSEREGAWHHKTALGGRKEEGIRRLTPKGPGPERKLLGTTKVPWPRKKMGKNEAPGAERSWTGKEGCLAPKHRPWASWRAREKEMGAWRHLVLDQKRRCLAPGKRPWANVNMSESPYKAWSFGQAIELVEAIITLVLPGTFVSPVLSGATTVAVCAMRNGATRRRRWWQRKVQEVLVEKEEAQGMQV